MEEHMESKQKNKFLVKLLKCLKIFSFYRFSLIFSFIFSVVEMKLTKFFVIASPLEQKWFIQILFKRLGLGLGEEKIIFYL